jgi:pilus assembly protein CpaB
MYQIISVYAPCGGDMKFNKKALIAAVLLSLITVILLNQYINSLKNKPETPIERTLVVTALNTIPAYVEIKEDMISTISIPAEAVHPDAVLDKEDIIGKITIAEIVKGEQLLKNRILNEKGGTSLSFQIPDNMRAMTIPDSEISGVGGYIVPKDRIDLLVSYSNSENDSSNKVITLLQDIEVLKVGPINSPTGENGIPTSLTILVTPEQAQLVANAAFYGSFHFTLRNPLDHKKVKFSAEKIAQGKTGDIWKELKY